MKGCPTSYEDLINEEEIECPNCGEFIVVVIDKSIDIQEYIEDCSVCCRPIQDSVFVDEDGTPDLVLSDENS